MPLRTGFNLVAWTGSDNTPIAGAVAALGGALESIFLWEARAERYLTFRPAAEGSVRSQTTTLMRASRSWAMQERTDGDLSAL